jgi:NADH:ubiquinone oxidoreductase subunit 3 (subunit A)
MYVNILIVIFCVAFIAVGIFAVFQMVRNSKKNSSKK